MERMQTPGVVVERLPKGYASLVPSQATSPLRDAAMLLQLAAATGDARLAARAEALLAQAPDGAQARRLRAFAAQHRHDFDAAARLLEAAVAEDPRDAASRLSLAQVRLVQGKVAEARRECVALALGVDASSGWMCAAMVAARRGDVAMAASSLSRWAAQAGRDRDTLRHAAVFAAELAGRAGVADAAERAFRAALTLAHDDVRTRLAYARWLAANGRHRDVLALIGEVPETDGLALRRALSAHALGVPNATLFARDVGARFATARALGTTPELRDEAEYRLVLAGDPQRALALAQANFATQRDREDVDILYRSAVAAQRPDVVASLRAWSREAGVAQ